MEYLGWCSAYSIESAHVCCWSTAGIRQDRRGSSMASSYQIYLVSLPCVSPLWKHSKWSWGQAQQNREEAAHFRLLVHSDPSKELLLVCDASPYGVGAMLSHQGPDRDRTIHSWRGGSSYCVWSQEISPIFVWAPFLHYLGPSNTFSVRPLL